MKISKEQYKKILLVKQKLWSRSFEKVNKNTILDTIKDLGLIQLDSINVIIRSHYTTIFSRKGFFDKTLLDEMIYPDKLLMEQWAHVASLMPMEHYTFFYSVHKYRQTLPLTKGRLKKLNSEPKEIFDYVLGKIKQDGELCSRDFKVLDNENRVKWWSRKPERYALDSLFRMGILSIQYRKNFIPYYNLSEKVLDYSNINDKLDYNDWLIWSTKKTISALGLASIKEIADYYRHKITEIRPIVKSMVDNNTLVEIEVKDLKEMRYMLSTDIKLIEKDFSPANITTFLSPFDNLIWFRERAEDLFSFHYKAQMFLPKQERNAGYYVMPILHNGNLVGRIDPKVFRDKKTFHLNFVRIEKSELLSPDFVQDMIFLLKDFMKFNDCNILTIDECNYSPLTREIKNVFCK